MTPEKLEMCECPSGAVIAGLDPAIHSVTAVADATVTEWMPGSSPGMTTVEGRGLLQSPTVARHDNRRNVVHPNVIEWDKIETKTVIPGFHGKFAHSANMTFVLWDIEAGAVLPEHSHVHEQVVHVYEGELEVTVAGEKTVLRGGSVGIIPSNAVHSGRALTDCRVMDAFYPLREDYMKGGAPSLLQGAMKTSR